MANLMFLSLLGFYTVFSLVIYFYAEDWNWEIVDGWELSCSNSTSDQNLNPLANYTNPVYVYCKGNTAVYRISASLGVFFFIMALFSTFTNRLHTGFWFWKVIVAFGLTAGSFYLPDFQDEAYVWIARLVSFLFIIMQQYLLVGFAYDWNDRWVDNASAEGNSEKCWLALILSCSFFLYAMVFAGIVFLYIGYGQCTIGSAITTLTVIAVIAFTVLALFRDRIVGVEGAILPSAVISGYVTYLAWSALESNPDSSCKAYDSSHDSAAMTVSIFIATVSIVWFANQNINSITGCFQRSDSQSNPPELLYQVGDGVTAQQMRREQGYGEIKKSSAPENTMVFHLVMVCSSLYLGMVVTNWSSNDPAFIDSGGKGAMWVKIIAQWLTFALFTWTLVAPGVLQNRKFGTPPSLQQNPTSISQV